MDATAVGSSSAIGNVSEHTKPIADHEVSDPDVGSLIMKNRSEFEAPLQRLALDVLEELIADTSKRRNYTTDGESESDEYCVVNSISGDLYIISDKSVEPVGLPDTGRQGDSDVDEAWSESEEVTGSVPAPISTPTPTNTEGTASPLPNPDTSRMTFSAFYRRTSNALEALSLQASVLKMPKMQMPDLKMPDLKMPELSMPPLRLRPSWNTSFSTAIQLLRYAGANLPRNVQALRFVSDNGIPKWTPLLPAGVSCEESRYPPGEWYYPTARGLTIRQNAQPESMSSGRFILYFHGGAFALCSTATHRGLLYRLAQNSQAAIFSVDYRRPPEHPFPTPVDDCLSAYLYILEKVGDSSRIIFAGDSAGGNLVVSTMLRIAELGLDMPAGGVLLSPWVDLDDPGESESWRVNSAFDYIDYASAALFANLYKAGAGESNVHLNLGHSSLSPLYSQHLSKLPPLLCEFGDCEVLRDQIQAFCDKLAGLGNSIVSHARADMVHVFPIYAFTGMSQCEEAFQSIVGFVNGLLGEPEPCPQTAHQSEPQSPDARMGVEKETETETEQQTEARTTDSAEASSSTSTDAVGNELPPTSCI